jgi:hypothetical protein
VVLVGQGAGPERGVAFREAVCPVSVPGSADAEHLLLDARNVALVIERLGQSLAYEIRQAEATRGGRAELTCLDDDAQRVMKAVEPLVGVGIQMHAEQSVQRHGSPGVKRLDSLLQLVRIRGEPLSARVTGHASRIG